MSVSSDGTPSRRYDTPGREYDGPCGHLTDVPDHGGGSGRHASQAVRPSASARNARRTPTPAGSRAGPAPSRGYRGRTPGSCGSANVGPSLPADRLPLHHQRPQTLRTTRTQPPPAHLDRPRSPARRTTTPRRRASVVGTPHASAISASVGSCSTVPPTAGIQTSTPSPGSGSSMNSSTSVRRRRTAGPEGAWDPVACEQTADRLGPDRVVGSDHDHLAQVRHLVSGTTPGRTPRPSDGTTRRGAIHGFRT